MFTFTTLFLLLIVAGWFDSRIDWQGQSPFERKEKNS